MNNVSTFFSVIKAILRERYTRGCEYNVLLLNDFWAFKHSFILCDHKCLKFNLNTMTNWQRNTNYVFLFLSLISANSIYYKANKIKLIPKLKFAIFCVRKMEKTRHESLEFS